jgi:hypothetical protein
VHIHLSTTNGGLSKDQSKWIPLFFNHQTIKNTWKYSVVNLFRKQYKKGSLKLPTTLRHIKNYSTFNSWLNFHYHKKWVVQIQKPSNNRNTFNYIAKYLKRPPIGETRIKNYDGNNVTFEYLDHYDKIKKITTIPAQEFITRLISHIPDRGFRVIRYFGFLANRVRSKLLPIVHSFFYSSPKIKNPFNWRNMIIMSFHYDPLFCPRCHNELQLSFVAFVNINFFSLHCTLLNKKN